MPVEGHGRGGEASYNTIRSVEVPEGPAMASEGSEGRGASSNVTSSSFGASDIVVVGAQQAHIRACPEGEGAHQPLHTRRRSPRGMRR